MLKTPMKTEPTRSGKKKSDKSKMESKRSPLRTKLPVDTSMPGICRQGTSYMVLPAIYTGIPNFLNYRIGPGADLREASLSSADLRWTNFRGANLRGAQFSESVLWGSTLTNADLTGADLSHADFTGVDLVGADLTSCKIEGTCFLGARYSQSTRFPKGFGHPESRGLISLGDDAYQVG